MKRKLSILFILVFLSACKRTTDNGEILKFYGDIKEDIGYSVAIASDGYFIGGQLTEITRNGNQVLGSSPKPGIIKTGSDGNTIWEKYMGDRLEGSFSKVIVLSDGSAAAAGQVTDTVTQKTDVFIAKINSDGTGGVWKTFSAAGNLTSKDLLQTSEGFLLLGTTDAERPVTSDSTGNYAGKKDILIMRIDNSLNLIDTPVPLGFPNNDEGVAVKPDIGGGYIIAGTTERYLLQGHKNDLFLWKINSRGISTQSAIIGGTDDENAADFEVLDDGYLIAGTISSTSGNDSVLIKKIPLNIYSDPLFTNKIGGSSSWSVNALSRYKSNSFVLAGQEGSSSQSKELIFVIDAGGNLVEGKVKTSGGTGVQASYDVVSDSENNIIAIGKNTYESNSMISLLKFKF
ncbi:MAG: hypothetical protein ABSA76_07480 [Bacteroidales bacterium]